MQHMDPSVGDIAEMADPVLRNLWITQRYHDFAVALRDAGLAENATWCAFAVWASKTAGATIRGEVLPARAKQLLLDNEATEAGLHKFNHGLLGRAVQKLTRDHLGRLVEGVTKDVSRQIAAGNVLVFAELAPIFAELLRVRDPKPANAEELAAAVAPALASLGSGADAASAATAFQCYGRALFAPADRTTLILQANILAVAHEQRRLQPAISGALNAAISDTLKKLIEDDFVRHLPIASIRHAARRADGRSLRGRRRGLGYGAHRNDHAARHRQRDVRSPVRRAASARRHVPVRTPQADRNGRREPRSPNGTRQRGPGRRPVPMTGPYSRSG